MDYRIVLYTQRVDVVESYGERRDCADQNIPRFLSACGYLPVPVPNIRDTVVEMVRQLGPAGIVLTGGNSLVKYGGDAPERDEMEKSILELAAARNIPVFGFCRGMQVVLDFFGCSLKDVQGHVAVRHSVRGQMGGAIVNSYHRQACFHVKEPLYVLAEAEDGAAEAVGCRQARIFACMWHPERESPFAEPDMQRVRRLFG